MSTLPNGPILISYNSVLFPTECATTITEHAVEDASLRTVKYVVYTVSVKATLGQSSQPGTTDATMASLRKLLESPGGELHVEGTGYGPLIANVPAAGPTVGSASGARDVIWGPWPKVMKWSPKGQLAAEVEWQVEVALSPCDNAAYTGGILEYVFGITYTNPGNGYDTRTIKGSISIPQTRASVDSTALVDHADRLREQVTPQVPAGYERTRSEFELSLDKCRIDFTFVDEQRGPEYPPPGVVSVKMTDGASTGKVGMGGQWVGSLRASYELARGVSQLVAIRHFLACLAQRRQAALDNPLPPSPYYEKSGQFVFARTFSIDNGDRYGPPTVNMTCTYEFRASLGTIFAGSGIFRPVPNSDWRLWALSMTANSNRAARSPWGPRGNGGLAFNAADEAIVDLCHQPGGGNVQAAAPPAEGAYLIPVPTDTPDDGAYLNEYPDPDVSWLRYDSDLRLEEVENVTVLKPLPPPDLQGKLALPPAQPPALTGGSSGGIPELTGGSYIGPATGPALDAGGSSGPIPDSGPSAASIVMDGAAGTLSGGAGANNPTVIVQRRADPTFYAYLEGLAMRAGYPIAPPKLLSVGGAKATPANLPGGGFACRLLEMRFGVPVYAAAWKFRYVLEGTPSGKVPVMDTPAANG